MIFIGKHKLINMVNSYLHHACILEVKVEIVVDGASP